MARGKLKSEHTVGMRNALDCFTVATVTPSPQATMSIDDELEQGIQNSLENPTAKMANSDADDSNADDDSKPAAISNSHDHNNSASDDKANNAEDIELHLEEDNNKEEGSEDD
jgi:hypothetical protein